VREGKTAPFSVKPERERERERERGRKVSYYTEKEGEKEAFSSQREKGTFFPFSTVTAGGNKRARSFLLLLQIRRPKRSFLFSLSFSLLTLAFSVKEVTLLANKRNALWDTTKIVGAYKHENNNENHKN